MNQLAPKTPLEYIGAGFLMMIIGGLIFTGAQMHGKSFDELVDLFVKAMWLPYLYLSAGFILYGMIQLFGSFQENPIYSKHVSPGSVLLAHWACAIILPERTSMWIRILVFLVVSVSVHEAGRFIKNRIK